jgi:hypothetical protein
MIKKIENKNTTYIEISFNKQNEDKVVNNSINEIEKIKLFPFSKIFIKIPLFVFDKFLIKLKNKNIKYKELYFKNNLAYFEF